MTGIGIFHLQARANFPTRTGAVVHGPYSTLMAFARTIPEPGGASADVTKEHVVLSWNPRMGAKNYRVQVSTRPDFDNFVENMTTEATNHAPLLSQRDYTDGGKLYWRVAAVDADANVGDFSPVQQFGLDQPLRLRTLGSPVRGRTGNLTVIATTSLDPIPGVSVRIWGAGLKAANGEDEGQRPRDRQGEAEEEGRHLLPRDEGRIQDHDHQGHGPRRPHRVLAQACTVRAGGPRCEQCSISSPTRPRSQTAS